ncbi:MAG: hypothetical protein ACKOC5_05990 [Chloroflexota bacterium]
MNVNPGPISLYRRRRGRMLALLAVLVACAGFVGVEHGFSSSQFTDISVNSTSGGTGGPECKLRDAITAANSGTTTGGCTVSGPEPYRVVFSIIDPIELTVVDNTTSNGDNGLPLITGEITILGQGNTILRSSKAGTPAFRLLEVDDGAALTVENLHLENGAQPQKQGGGIYNAGSLYLRQSHVSFSQAEKGGAILNAGLLTMTVTTLYHNQGASQGGAIQNMGDLVAGSCLIGYNVGGCGGAINSSVGTTLSITHSTLTGNTAYI